MLTVTVVSKKIESFFAKRQVTMNIMSTELQFTNIDKHRDKMNKYKKANQDDILVCRQSRQDSKYWITVKIQMKTNTT